MIPAYASASPAFLMMYSAYKLNKQGDNIIVVYYIVILAVLRMNNFYYHYQNGGHGGIWIEIMEIAQRNPYRKKMKPAFGSQQIIG